MEYETETSDPIAGKSRRDWTKHWKREMEAEDERNRNWRKRANQITDRYLDDRAQAEPTYALDVAEFRVNLFYSNTFTQQGFLYGRLPSASVERRFTDTSDDVARAASNILQRMLTTSIEADGENFSAVLRASIQDHLIPGLAVARVRYDYAAKTEKILQLAENLEEGEEPETEEIEVERLLWEEAPIDYIHWQDFHWGWCRLWADVPWVGFDVSMNRKEVEERFGKEYAKQLSYAENRSERDSVSEANDTRRPDHVAVITEIWHRDSNHVFWYSFHDDIICDIKEDPLELPGFYPCPRPMVANATTRLFRPRPYFALSQDLYNEVDELSTRINLLTKAVKVSGAYDKSFPELQRIVESAVENQLIAVDNWAMFGEKGGLRGVTDMFPLGEVIVALDKLREMRRETIELLWEVTGLSDIFRGQGQKYEGVGKARLKAQFGSIRMQYLQEEFARYASDLLTLRAQVIANHFSPQTIAQQANVAFSYDVRYAQDAIQLLKEPEAAVWRVEVKPESMAMVDWSALKAERTEYLQAVAMFLQSSAPLLEREPGAAPLLLEMLKWGLAGFKGGQEIETVLDIAIQQAIQASQQRAQQQQQQQNPEVLKTQAKMRENQQKFQQDMAKQADKAQKELQKLVTEFQTDLARIRAEAQADFAREEVQANQAIREQAAKVALMPARRGGSDAR